ncbi:MAG TPA: hypothetical protein VIH87_12380 [Methylocella sp.]
MASLAAPVFVYHTAGVLSFAVAEGWGQEGGVVRLAPSLRWRRSGEPDWYFGVIAKRRMKAAARAAPQNHVSIVLETRHAGTARLRPIRDGTRYRRFMRPHDNDRILGKYVHPVDFAGIRSGCRSFLNQRRSRFRPPLSRRYTGLVRIVLKGAQHLPQQLLSTLHGFIAAKARNFEMLILKYFNLNSFPDQSHIQS